LLIHHARAHYVQTVAKQSGLELALLSSYRLKPRRGEGLLLRFGGLSLEPISRGCERLVHTASDSRA
jgi:hypothetical protein